MMCGCPEPPSTNRKYHDRQPIIPNVPHGPIAESARLRASLSGDHAVKLEAVAGRADVILDGGIRRGSDVIKALALGAKAVGIGRPLYWGLATEGEDGVHNVLELLREEVDRCLAFCGQSDVTDLESALINIPNNWGPGSSAP